MLNKKKPKKMEETNDFYLALKDGTTDEYVKSVDKFTHVVTYGTYDEAMWSLQDWKVQQVITQNSIPASVETKTGGTQPPSRPPF